MAYTKADLKHDLVAMGLTGNETILIHSSMKSIGPVEGGADTVLDALMEFFAEGLLLLPTHTWRFINEENRVFDVRRSPCCVGILPELFRQRRGGALAAPTHSMAAYGKGRAAYRGRRGLDATPLPLPAAATTGCGQPTAKCCCWGSPTPATPLSIAWRRY